jgi:hypothetical protein
LKERAFKYGRATVLEMIEDFADFVFVSLQFPEIVVGGLEVVLVIAVGVAPQVFVFVGPGQRRCRWVP